MKLTLKPIAVVLNLALFSQTALTMACASSCEMASTGKAQQSAQPKSNVASAHHDHSHRAAKVDSAKQQIPSLAGAARCLSCDVSPQITNLLVPRESVAVVKVVQSHNARLEKSISFPSVSPDIAATPPKSFTVLRI